jgi:hypothetical protein
MMKLFRAGMSILALSLGACSIHPLPDEVTHLPTNQIVRHVRCEARAAIKDNLLQYLELSTPSDRKIAAGIEDGTIPFETVSDAMFDGYTKAIVQKFESAAIAYDFIFDITDINDIDPSLNFVDIFSKSGKLATGLGGGFDRTRESTRNFSTHDTFIKLIALEGIPDKKAYCPDVKEEPNYAYPIAGTVGLAESLHQFITMSLFDNLGKDSGPATMVDKLIFTTKLSLNATPMVTLTPVGSGVHFLNGMLGLTASRNDVHTLNVAFALPPTQTNISTTDTSKPPAPSSTPLAAKLAAPAAQNAPLVLPTQLPQEVLGTGVRSGLFINASGTPAELLAAEALDQAILRFEVGKGPTAVIPTP